MASRPIRDSSADDQRGSDVLVGDAAEPAAQDRLAAERPSQDPAAGDVEPGFRWWHLLVPLGAFLASRVVGHTAAAVAAYVKQVPTTSVLGAWDGRWYLRAALEGYPSTIGSGDFYAGDVTQVQSTIAFFPLYPGLSRGVMEVLGVGALQAELLVGALAGALATCLVWALARDVYGRTVADRAAVLFAFAPGAIVLSMIYAEGLAIALVAGSLLLMRHHRWITGGLVAALATATRPNALVLIGVCVWMAGVAIHRRREWRALAAPALAPVGALGYFGYLWAHTGNPRAWFDVQHRGWGERTDFGVRSWELTVDFLQDPLVNPYVLLHGLSLLAALGLLALLVIRPRPPAELTLFSLGVIGLSLASATLNARPRFLFFAFPLIIVLARWMNGRTFGVVAAASGGAMALLGVFYFLEQAYYP